MCYHGIKIYANIKTASLHVIDFEFYILSKIYSLYKRCVDYKVISVYKFLEKKTDNHNPKVK